MSTLKWSLLIAAVFLHLGLASTALAAPLPVPKGQFISSAGDAE